LQRPRREVPVFVVDRLDARAINRQQLAPEQIKPPAQQHELPEHLFERGAIVAPEIGDGLEVRLQASQQPDDFGCCDGIPSPAGGLNAPVQIAIDVELQEIGWRIAGAAYRLRLDTHKPRRREVEFINEGVDEPHRIVGVDIIVHRLRQQQKLRTFESGNMSHARF
jgi:hypothetical protein